VEGSLHAKNQLDSVSRFDTIPACDKRTHDDSKYHASMAACAKNLFQLSPTVLFWARGQNWLNTRSSAIAKGLRDASCQLKSYQLPCNSAETTCTTSPEQIEVMKLES